MSNVDRIEQLLQFWEEAIFRDVISTRFQERLGVAITVRPPKEYRNIRKMLLGANSGELDIEGYLPSGPHQSCDLDSVPQLFHSWCRSSRKMYHLSDDFRELLGQTSLEEVELGEIRLPFEAIAISLETPLHHESSGADFDVLMLWQIPDGIFIQLLPKALEDREVMSRVDRDRLAMDAATSARGSFRQREKTFNRLQFLASSYASLRVPFGAVRIRVPPGVTCTNKFLVGSLRASHPEFGDCLAEVFRIGIGLSFYLSQPKGEGRESVRTERLPVSPDPMAITSEVDVCYIGLLEKLTVPGSTTPNDNVIPRGPHGTSPSAHWRTGYWRRRAGEGNDPNAPRVIWVRPSLVRKDRLAEGELPAGRKYEV